MMPFDGLAASLNVTGGLDPARPSVLGFSGGPDSAALLHALHAAGWPLLVAHLDHGLRPESVAEARAAAETAAGYGLPFFTERADVAARAERAGQSIEEAARAARYEFLFRVAGQQGAQAVLTAHTADDQSETILMHLLRGAGPAGLRGMPARLLPNPWSEDIPLVRPLLQVSREEVLAYCSQHSLQPLHDPSNTDPAFFRNKLRHEMLPLMESYAPGFKRRLRQTGELLAADVALIDELTASAWRRCLAQRGPGFVGLQRTALQAEPLALQRGVLRRAAGELRPQQRDVSYAQVEHALEAIAAGHSVAQDWFAGLVVLVEGDMAWLAERKAELPAAWPQAPESAMHIEAPGSALLNGGWRLDLAEGEPPAGRADNADRYQAWLDLERSGAELTLRRPRPGDRIAALGLGGTQKLADLFTNEKLPRRARAAWPLLCKSDEILWVPGYRIAEPFRLQAGTRRALHARLSQMK